MDKNPQHHRIGVDLGGTKIEGVVLDNHGTVVARQRVETPAGDYQGTLDALAGVCDRLEEQAGVPRQSLRVGIGHPGSISPVTGLLRNANSICLNGHPIVEELEARLGRRVRTANDANCFALSEATDGPGAGHEVVFGVIVGTGTGGGVVVHQRLIAGAGGLAGEWGHTPLPWPTAAERDRGERTPCWCGRPGCLETWLSGTALGADHRFENPDNLLPNGRAVAEAAAQGDARAQKSLVRHAERMARALAALINLLDPGVIVLGGGLSSMPHLYTEVPKLWAKWVFSDTAAAAKLMPPRHGDASGVRGAAWLWAAQESA